jgi:hypothetical protein
MTTSTVVLSNSCNNIPNPLVSLLPILTAVPNVFTRSADDNELSRKWSSGVDSKETLQLVCVISGSFTAIQGSSCVRA